MRPKSSNASTAIKPSNVSVFVGVKNNIIEFSIDIVLVDIEVCEAPSNKLAKAHNGKPLIGKEASSASLSPH